MYARVATFEIPPDTPPEVGDKIAAEVKRRITEDDPIPGAKRVMIVGSPELGRAMNITVFESEEDMRAAEAHFERMNPVPASQDVGGRRLDVSHYRLLLDEQVG